MQTRLPFAPKGDKRPPSVTAIDLPGAHAWVVHNAFSPEETAILAQELRALPHWEYRDIVVHGRPCKQNRRSCALTADPGRLVYRYSGVDDSDAPPMTVEVRKAMARAAELVPGDDFEPNYCLLNWYANGKEVVGWHADQVRDLDPPHWIASVSVGATRRFEFRNRGNKQVVQKIDLVDGCMVVMGQNVQQLYEHRIAPNARVTEPRFNLTFRQVRPSQ